MGMPPACTSVPYAVGVKKAGMPEPPARRRSASVPCVGAHTRIPFASSGQLGRRTVATVPSVRSQTERVGRTAQGHGDTDLWRQLHLELATEVLALKLGVFTDVRRDHALDLQRARARLCRRDSVSTAAGHDAGAGRGGGGGCGNATKRALVMPGDS